MINLGLGDVLLNAETGEIYIPNTNKLFKMGENSTENTQNPQEDVDNVPNSIENPLNNEDLNENGINTPEEDKKPEMVEKEPKKGGV
jgi:hypothetical protein